MRNKINNVKIYLAFGIIVLISMNSALAEAPGMASYHAKPLIMSAGVRPNILLLLDSSGSMIIPAYSDGAKTYNTATIYDGYFDPAKFYKYQGAGVPGDYFYIDKTATPATVHNPPTTWSGNVLNFLCMRRIDIAKSVLTGGKTMMSGTTPVLVGLKYHYVDSYTAPQWGGAGRSKTIGSKTYKFNPLTIGGGPHPNADENTAYNDPLGPYFIIDGAVPATKYYIRVEAEETPKGIVQNMADEARFGLEIYCPMEDMDEGGKVLQPIGASTDAIVNDINAEEYQTSTPIAESVFTAIGYFKQDTGYGATSPRRHDTSTGTNIDYTNSPTWDPFNGSAYCVKSFVIIITDGEANSENGFPAAYLPTKALTPTGYNGTVLTTYGDVTAGSDKQLDNIAYYAHTQDLKTEAAFQPAIQNLTFYTVFAFGSGSALLKSAARLGGFEDSDGDNVPDIDTEWSDDGGVTPRNYFEGSTAAQLKSALSMAISSILDKVSSGSAISMLSTNTNSGEGTIIQAYFRPSYKEGVKTAKWLGYLQSFWVDDQFNLRQDQDPDSFGKLDKTKDKIIRFETVDGDTKIRVIDVDDDYPYGTGSGTIIELTDSSLKPVWDAGKKLLAKAPADRKIFTFLDANKDGIAQDSDTANSHVDNSGEVRRLNTDMNSLRDALKPYLGVTNDADWAYLDKTTGAVNNRVVNLVDWIRGKDSGFLPAGATNMRARIFGTNTSAWKLGDIINSTPMAIGNPQQRYDVLYSDLTYTEFRKFVRGKAPAVPNGLDRETVVYVGANDGMLHAFTAGIFDPLTSTFIKGPSNQDLGDELWAYVPQALLPHLKWLPHKNYPHIYYVDLTPVIMDVRIFDPDPDKHPNGWGTILLCGLNWGGKTIQVPDFYATAPTARTFSSSYFCLDITNPLQPRVLWERSYANLGLTTSIPAIVRVGDESVTNKSKWFAVFGSGPTDFKGVTNQEARIFVVDLKTGEPKSRLPSPKPEWFDIATSGVTGYMNSPASYDKYLDYNVDGVYFGESYFASGSWKGRIWKLPIPDLVSDPSKKEPDPANWTQPYSMLNFNAPITGAVSVGVGKNKASHVFFGTGRYIEDSDKTSTTSQYLVGLVDPEPFVSTYNLLTDLFEVGGTTGDLTKGWYYNLTPGERSLTKPLVYAGSAIFATFKPSNDICGYGGNGYLYINNFYNGTLFCSTDLGAGNPSQPIVRTKSGGKTKVDVLGRSLGSGDNSAIAISQSSTGAVVKKDISLINVPRSKFLWWREP